MRSKKLLPRKCAKFLQDKLFAVMFPSSYYPICSAFSKTACVRTRFWKLSATIIIHGFLLQKLQKLTTKLLKLEKLTTNTFSSSIRMQNQPFAKDMVTMCTIRMADRLVFSCRQMTHWRKSESCHLTSLDINFVYCR